MSADGEQLAPARLSGGGLVPLPAPTSQEHRESVFEDFVGRLRPYVAPPPPDELGWQAVSGVGMTLLAAGLLWLLPSGHTVGSAPVLQWVGSQGLASTVESVRAVPLAPIALFALAVLLGIGLIYWRGIGAQPALIFLTAQSWIGVLAATVVGLVWVYLLLVLAINLVIWALVIVFMVVAVLFALSIVLGMLAALADA